MPDQWKQGVGGLVRRYRRRGAYGSGRGLLHPWTDEVSAGVRRGIDDLDEVDEFDEPLDDQHRPIDLSAMRADDALLDALGQVDGRYGGAPNGRHAREDELERLLRAWRGEVDATPLPMLYDTESAVEVIEQATRSRRTPPRWLVPVASAAAVLVIGFTSLGLAARDAQPGDTLWGLTQVLYADHAKSVEAAVTVRQELSHASLALQEGHYTEARTALSLAQASLPSVDNSDGRADLQAKGQQLAAQLSQGVVPPTATSVSATSPVATTTSPTTTPSPTTSTTTQPTQTTPSSSTPTTSTPSAAGPATIDTSAQTHLGNTGQASASSGGG